MLETIRKGVRRQDAIEPEKYKCVRKFSDLPLDYTHLVAVVKMAVMTRAHCLWNREKGKKPVKRKKLHYHYDREADVMYLLRTYAPRG